MSDTYDFDQTGKSKKRTEDEQAAKIRYQRDLEDLQVVLSTKEGRRFVWTYLGTFNVMKLSAEASGSMTYFNEGKRSAANKLLAMILNASPEQYLKMMKEAQGENT